MAATRSSSTAKNCCFFGAFRFVVFGGNPDASQRSRDFGKVGQVVRFRNKTVEVDFVLVQNVGGLFVQMKMACERATECTRRLDREGDASERQRPRSNLAVASPR
jgi:hypothetical protein